MAENPTVEYSRKATLAKLLALKERPKRETVTVHVPGIDTTVELRKLPLAEFMSLDNRLAELDADEPELQEQYDCKVPTDIVGKILLDDLGDWTFLGAAINRMYGLGRDETGEAPQETVKN